MYFFSLKNCTRRLCRTGASFVGFQPRESQADRVEGVGEEGGVGSTAVCYGDRGRGRLVRTYVSRGESMPWGFMTYRGISGTGYSGTGYSGRFR